MNGEQTGEAVDQAERSTDSGDEVGRTEVSEVEAKARRMGWTDQEEFRGHPDRWVDAETYVARADEHLPILKGTVAAMDKKMAAQEALILEQNTRIKAMQEDFKEFVGFTRKAEERSYKKALEQLKIEQRQAVEDQDLDKFDKVSADIDAHLQSNPAAAEAKKLDKEGPRSEAVFSEEVYNGWLQENPWYKERPKMAVYAQQIDRWVSDTKPHLSQKERLAEITKLVKEEFPDYWAIRKAGGKGSPVEGSDAGGVVIPKGKRTYANLPPDAKAACDKFCGKDGKGGSISGYTREDYLRDYDWSE